MKTETKTTQIYICDVCGYKSPYKKAIEFCEESHKCACEEFYYSCDLIEVESSRIRLFKCCKKCDKIKEERELLYSDENTLAKLWEMANADLGR